MARGEPELARENNERPRKEREKERTNYITAKKTEKIYIEIPKYIIWIFVLAGWNTSNEGHS